MFIKRCTPGGIQKFLGGTQIVKEALQIFILEINRLFESPGSTEIEICLTSGRFGPTKLTGNWHLGIED